MRRLAAFAVLVAVALQGQAPAATPIRATGHYYAVDYGYALSKDKIVAIQAAHDAAAAYLAAFAKANPGVATRAYLHVPADIPAAQTSAPFYQDSNNIETVRDGEGPDGNIFASAAGHPAIIVGFQRVSPGGFTPGPAVRPSLVGVLDSTAATTAKPRYGLALGPVFAFGFGTILDRGDIDFTAPAGNRYADAWALTQKFTYEVAIGPAPGTTSIPAGVFAGIGSNPVGVFSIQSLGAGKYIFRLSTQAAPFAVPVTTRYRFAAGDPTGLHKIAVAVDVSGPSGPVLSAYIADPSHPAGVQVAVTSDAPPPSTKVSVNQNISLPFLIGQASSGASYPPFGQQVPPCNLYGLAVTRSIRYVNGGPGSPQARADGGPLCDSYRYFAMSNPGFGPTLYDPAAMASIAFDENPATGQRHLLILADGNPRGGPGGGVLLIGDPAQQFGAPGTGNGVAIRHLNVSTASQYGAAVLLCGGLNTVVEDSSLVGGRYGVAVLPVIANYYHRIERTTLSGQDSGLATYASDFTLRDVTFGFNGRASILSVDSNVAADGVRLGATAPNQESFAQMWAGDYGGMYSFRHVMDDNEGRGYLRAGFFAQRGGASILDIDQCYFATMGATTPVIDLDDVASDPTGKSYRTAVLSAKGIMVGSGAPVGVRSNGPGWAGAVRDSFVGGVVSTGTFGPASVQVISQASPQP